MNIAEIILIILAVLIAFNVGYIVGALKITKIVYGYDKDKGV